MWWMWRARVEVERWGWRKNQAFQASGSMGRQLGRANDA